MALEDRRAAAKYIASLEKRGGIILPCKCFMSVSANELRKLLELIGPKELFLVVKSISCNVHESKRTKSKKSKPKNPVKKKTSTHP